MLVLDDLQELDAGSPAMRLVEGIVWHAPARLHVVLAGRDAPPFPVDRLRGQGQLLELTGATLAFDDLELSRLLAFSVAGAPPELARELRIMTGGWPAAVRLTIEAMKDVPAPERENVLRIMRTSEGPLIGYLAREVFQRQPDPVRRLVRLVAVLDRFDAPLCRAPGLSMMRPPSSPIWRGEACSSSRRERDGCGCTT